MAFDPTIQSPKKQTRPGVIYEDNVIPDAEGNSEIGNIEAAISGILSGLIKIPEGFVSLGAELLDFGLGTKTASSVEQFFDKIKQM